MSTQLKVFALVSILLCGWWALACAQMEEVPMIRISAEVEIAAPPADVWTHLTTGTSLVAWCPYWADEANGKVNVTKVGDVLAYQDDWGNRGRSIVTFLKKQSEIRVAHEPTDGSYVCQSKFILESSEGSTVVIYIEQYTDESSEEDAEATAEQMAGQMRKALSALKKQVEKKS